MMAYNGKAIMFDMDGVLYRGTSHLPHAAEAVEWARRQGLRIGFITNNSTRSVKTYLERLAGFGIRGDVSEMMTSAIATAEYIRATYGEGGTAFVIGLEGIRETLAQIAVDVVGVHDNRKCDYVVVGMSPDFDYKQLTRAQQEILINKAIFIGTNNDRTFPWNDGTLRPGGGTIVAAVVACTDATPIIIGKPNTYMIEMMARQYGLKPADCLVVGDRIDTDIVMGRRFGAHTLLVLTGISKRDDVARAVGDSAPEFVIDDLNGFEKAVESLWGG